MIIINHSLDEILKSPRKPSLGSFYILDGALFYNTISTGLDHPKLWQEIILKCGIFDNLVYENKQELINAPYGTDRGRVTWSGKHAGDAPDLADSTGHFSLIGTPGCEPFEEILKSTFGLRAITTKVDWQTDLHYKTVPSDVKTLADMLRFSKGKGKIQTTSIFEITN